MPRSAGHPLPEVNPIRRSVLRAAGALGLSGLTLAGCATRAPRPAEDGAPGPGGTPSSNACLLYTSDAADEL